MTDITNISNYTNITNKDVDSFIAIIAHNKSELMYYDKMIHIYKNVSPTLKYNKLLCGFLLYVEAQFGINNVTNEIIKNTSNHDLGELTCVRNIELYTSNQHTYTINYEHIAFNIYTLITTQQKSIKYIETQVKLLPNISKFALILQNTIKDRINIKKELGLISIKKMRTYNGSAQKLKLNN